MNPLPGINIDAFYHIFNIEQRLLLDTTYAEFSYRILDEYKAEWEAMVKEVEEADKKASGEV